MEIKVKIMARLLQRLSAENSPRAKTNELDEVSKGKSMLKTVETRQKQEKKTISMKHLHKTSFTTIYHDQASLTISNHPNHYYEPLLTTINQY